jgi:hypothetical protein
MPPKMVLGTVAVAAFGHIVDVRVRAAIQDDVLRMLGTAQRTIDVEAR